MSSFQSIEDIRKEEGGPDCTISNNKFSSDPEETGNESHRKHTVILSHSEVQMGSK